MKAKRKIQEYLTRGVRHLKHRKGFGVHSPFAFSIITEVIEEKTPYYAYQRMRRTYNAEGRRAPISFKVACLLFRLANRFRVRRVLEVGCDGGYTLLPLVLFDSRGELRAVGSEAACHGFADRFGWLGPKHLGRVAFASGLGALPPDFMADMVVVSDLPDGMDEAALTEALLPRLHERSILWVKGIRPGRRLEEFWDRLCDREDIAITMDLYDYGLAIRKPRFFKQHYVVSF